jgi:hypothetical protein
MRAFFSFFFVLFAEVREHFFPCREAEIVRQRNADNAMPTVLNFFAFNLYDTFNAVIRAVEVQVAFFDFLFHNPENDRKRTAHEIFFDYFFGQVSCQVIFFVRLAQNFFLIFLLTL